MKQVFLPILLGFLAVFLPTLDAATDKLVCYYGSWAVYRPTRGRFDVEQIDPNLCTHLIYTFIGIKENGEVRVLDSWNDLEEDYGKGAFKRFVNLKQRNPKVKTLIAIGGWNEGSEKYSKVVRDDNLRANFVKSVMAFLERFGFDGFDIDWEYPNQRGGSPDDKENYVKLIKDLSEAFKPKGYILSAAVAAAEFSMSQSYNVKMLSKYLDMINVMAYDLHGSWEKTTGHNAPLKPSSKDKTELEKQLNVVACIKNWIAQGADPSKLVLGMPTYGRSFTLADPSNTGLGSLSYYGGVAGPYTRESGMIGYNEVVELQNQGGWTVAWDDEQEVPHMYKGDQWIGYDDLTSITKKVEFAKEMRLGGVMIWSIETDDFNGVSKETFPILKTINAVLNREIPTGSPIPSTTSGSTSIKTTTVATEKTTTRDPSAPTTTPNPSDPSSWCKKDASYVRDPADCGHFFYCMWLGDHFKTFEFRCPEGLKFDLKLSLCNYPELVDCTD